VLIPDTYWVIVFAVFEIADIDADGWDDIILHPTDFSARFRINPIPAPK
jgi:hypothetical protein